MVLNSFAGRHPVTDLPGRLLLQARATAARRTGRLVRLSSVRQAGQYGDYACNYRSPHNGGQRYPGISPKVWIGLISGWAQEHREHLSDR